MMCGLREVEEDREPVSLVTIIFFLSVIAALLNSSPARYAHINAPRNCTPHLSHMENSSTC